MIEPRTWMPDGAFSLDTVSSALDPVLDGWSKTWIGRSVVKVAAMEAADVPRTTELPSSGELRAPGTSVDVVLRPKAKRRLLEALLDVDLTSATLGVDDWRLLDGLASDAQQDLLNLLDMAAGVEAGPRSARLSLAANGQEVALLDCSRAFMVHAVRSARRETGAFPKLQHRWAAVARTELDLRVRIGRSRLTVDEVRHIEPGDVLVLDREVSAPVELVLAASGRAVATARLGKNGDRSVLTL